MRRLSWLAALATLVISLAFAVGATAAGAPGVATGTGSATSDTAATVSGTVNPNGEATAYAFQYGTSTAYGLQSSPASAGSGSAPTPRSAGLTGLAPGTTYHFRILATNGSGTTAGSDATFKTSGTAPAATTPPTATTGAATGVGSSGATLTGSVDPNGQPTTVHFEYGLTSAYGSSTATRSAGSGTSSVSESAGVSGLRPATTYHFRIVAVNSSGRITTGSDRTFRTATVARATARPAVSTGSADGIGRTGAIVHGTVNAEGQATSFAFQYGTTTRYGLQSRTRAATGSATHPVGAGLGGLRSGTVYHYRLVATNASGTSVGADRTFRTTGAPPRRGTPPVARTLRATQVGVHRAVLNGAVVANSSTTTYTFEFGATRAYGLETRFGTLPAGGRARAVRATVFRLQANRTYHYRLVATNAGGTTVGADRTFFTGGVRPRRVTATTTPRRARRFPYRFTTRGRVVLPRGMRRAEGCRGRVTVRFRAGRRTVSVRRVRLDRRCGYRSRVVLGRRAHLRRGTRLRVLVRFDGNVVLRPRSARTQVVRAG